MKGASYFLRNFTATAVREHLRSQIEDSGGSPDLTKNELDSCASSAKARLTGAGFSPRNVEATRRPSYALSSRLLGRKP